MKMTVMLALVAVMALPVGAVEVGEKAPEFKLMDQNGTAVKLSDSAGSIRVLEWTNPECPFVVRHYKAETMKKLAAKYGDKNVVWLTINSSHHQDRDTNLAMIKTLQAQPDAAHRSGWRRGPRVRSQDDAAHVHRRR
jgi:peroxiredoxin